MKKRRGAGAFAVLAVCMVLSGCQERTESREVQNGVSAAAEGESGEEGREESGKEHGEADGSGAGENREEHGGAGGSEADENEAGESGTEANGAGAKETEAKDGKQSGRDGLRVRVLENLGTDVDLLTDVYCKDGAIGDRVSFYPERGEAEDPNGSDILHLNMEMAEEERWNGVQVMGDLMGDETEYAVWTGASAEIRTEKGKRTYETELTYCWSDTDGAGAEEKLQVTVTFPAAGDRDPYIQIAGDRRVAGKYHSLQHGYEMPDLFRRYLTPTDLCSLPTDELRILRNTVYAAHGRWFQSEELQKYFETKSWYRAAVQPDNFSEAALPDLEKENVKLIQKMEQLSDADRSRIDGQPYDPKKLSEAPYLRFLNLDGTVELSAEDLEIGVYTEDKKNAADCGVYWEIPGRIAHPVSLTEEQYGTVVGGNPVEICVDETTGETKFLEFFRESGFVLYGKGARPDTEDPKWYNHMTGDFELVGVRENYRTGLYELWADSDDTLMKTVYQGDIYIMKGAVEGSYLSLESASRRQSPVFPEDMVFGDSQMGTFRESVGGNHIRHNGRGYLTAVYYLGD